MVMDGNNVAWDYVGPILLTVHKEVVKNKLLG